MTSQLAHTSATGLRDYPAADALVGARPFTVQAADGVELRGVAWGSGPGLLLVHGFGGAKEDFFDHARELSELFTVVTFDLRGHGESGKPVEEDRYTLETLRADTLAVADANGFDDFVLLGHSMGGMVVRRIAVDLSHRVRALVLMDTSPGPVPGFAQDLIDLAIGVARNDGKAALKELLDMASPLNNDAYMRAIAANANYERFMDRKWDAVSIHMWSAMASVLAVQPDDLDAMRALSMPVHIIVGELDAPFRISADAMHAAIPTSSVAIINGAGHSPQFENPDDWYNALRSFLDSL